MKQIIPILMATALLGDNAEALTFEEAAIEKGYTTSTSVFALHYGVGLSAPIDSWGGLGNYTLATTINVPGSSLTSIGANQFAGMSSLEKLDLRNSPSLLALDANAFSGLSNLRHLLITDTQITELHANQFADTSLETLNLSANNSLIFHDNALSGLSGLSQLYLDYFSTELSLLELNLHGAEFGDSLNEFSVYGNIEAVSLEMASLSQNGFNKVMEGGTDGAGTSWTGIAENNAISLLNMRNSDLSSIADMSEMYVMDALETLLLEGAQLGDVDQLDDLVANLDSLTDFRLSQDQWDAMGAST